MSLSRSVKGSKLWRPYPCATWRPARARIILFPAGLHVLACLLLSRWTDGRSLLHHCGPQHARVWGSSTSSPLLTALRATRWWSACTGRSRTLYVHAGRAQRGILIYRGCSSVYVQLRRRTQRSLRLSLSWARHSSCQDSWWTCRSPHLLTWLLPQRGLPLTSCGRYTAGAISGSRLGLCRYAVAASSSHWRTRTPAPFSWRREEQRDSTSRSAVEQTLHKSLFWS